jgi:hypothetical protein
LGAVEADGYYGYGRQVPPELLFSGIEFQVSNQVSMLLDACSMCRSRTAG